MWWLWWWLLRRHFNSINNAFERLYLVLRKFTSKNFVLEWRFIVKFGHRKVFNGSAEIEWFCLEPNSHLSFHRGGTVFDENSFWLWENIQPAQRPSHLRTIEKKVLFYFQKLKSVPVTQTSEKIIASFKVLSWFDTIIHQKIEKVSQKKYFLNNFTSNHPIATQIPNFSNG